MRPSRLSSIGDWMAYGLVYVAVWLVLGLLVSYYIWWPGFDESRTELIISVILGPLLYVLATWVTRFVSDDAGSKEPARVTPMKHFWHFAFTVVGTLALILLVYMGIPWLATRI